MMPIHNKQKPRTERDALLRHRSACIQLMIFSFLFNQFLMCSPLNDPSLLQYHNAVTVAYR